MATQIKKLSKTEINSKLARLPVSEGRVYQYPTSGVVYQVASVSWGAGECKGQIFVTYFEVLQLSQKAAIPKVPFTKTVDEFVHDFQLLSSP